MMGRYNLTDFERSVIQPPIVERAARCSPRGRPVQPMAKKSSTRDDLVDAVMQATDGDIGDFQVELA